jgi:hypothetical protein
MKKNKPNFAQQNLLKVTCGPLSLCFSGVCPDASVKDEHTAH